MNSQNNRNFSLGVLFFLVPVYIFFTWIYAASAADEHAASVAVFNKFFPALLHDYIILSFVNISCAALAIVFFKKMRDVSKPVEVLIYTIMIVCAFFILFNLWGLM